MAIQRTDIERALDDLISQEEGMRFQGLAVVLGKQRWPELIANERKKDFGLDAYAPPSLTPERVGKGLAGSITATLDKVSTDATTAKENHPDLKVLLFVTPTKVGNPTRRKWAKRILEDHDVELHIIGREDVIAEMMLPANASLCARFLHRTVDSEPDVADLIDRTRRAAGAVTRNWASKTKGHPLIELTAVRLDPTGAESAEALSLERIDQALSRSGRIVLEGPAGRGKTTTLIQLALRERVAGIPFIVDLSPWTTSRRPILEYIAGMPAFLAEGLTSGHLARVQQTEPFLLLLNGWNEITESSSPQANDALRELERDLPSAGIIVATRTHHLIPPLPGALRLRLLRLRPSQRADYLAARLGVAAAEFRARLAVDPSLDELTRTPFILSEVVSLFEAGAAIPPTKFSVLAQVLRLHEQREEHENSLQAAPISSRQAAYLKALATEMTRRGGVALSDADARAVVASVAGDLMARGQIGPTEAPAVLAALTAHHVLERVDYPGTAFQFEHQQLQEYFAALDVRAQLLKLPDGDHEATDRFTARYVNEPEWAEPLRMVAETFAEQTGDEETDNRNVRAGVHLVNMALAVDLVSAGELARLCGPNVWRQVRAVVDERFRAAYALSDGHYRQYAVAAMLATGADDFADIIVPLLSGPDQQTRLRTCRLWPDIHLSSLGPDWREQVGAWSEAARTDFVFELLHHRVDDEIASFAVDDNSAAVKTAAVSGLTWTGSHDAMTRVLDSADGHTFETLAREFPDRLPPAFRPQVIAAMRNVIESATDPSARLRTALQLIKLGESGLDRVVRDSLAALPRDSLRTLDSYFIRPAVEHLHATHPAWTSEWVLSQIAEGTLSRHEEWFPFVTVVPENLVETYLHRLETEHLGRPHYDGMIAVIAAGADPALASRVFAKVRELRRRVDAGPGQQHEFEWQVMTQLAAVFRHLPDDVAAAGVLSSVTSGDPLDVKVAADLLSRVARTDMEPLRVADDDLRERLRAYLKSSVALVLRQDDFDGKEKANLASSIAQVGQPEDMADLVMLIRADIERLRRGRAARAAGDDGPLANGAYMGQAIWHIAALQHLGQAGADHVLISLLREPEYSAYAAGAMTRYFLPEPDGSLHRKIRYDLMWAAREDRTPPARDSERRKRLAAALTAELERLREQSEASQPTAGQAKIATALAAIDGRRSAQAVLGAIAVPEQWDEYTCLQAAERLLMAGVVLPATAAFAVVDAILVRTGHGMQDSDRNLLCRALALCPFIDDPAAGIAKIRDVLAAPRLRGYELRDLIAALGESRSDAAIDLLSELASDAPTLEQCEGEFINAFAAPDTPRARELLLGFVDPDIRGIALTREPDREDVLVARLAELAQRSPEAAERLRELCERDLPEINRNVLSKVMGRLGTSEDLLANLNLIDDARSPPVPRGVWEQLENAFVERQPYGDSPHVFTLHARASNKLRTRLFAMVREDRKRRHSASMLLGQIEAWRLEHGRPMDEPRHPDLASGQSWPPSSFDCRP